MTTFLLHKRYDHYTIINDDADFIVGRVYPLRGQQGPYRVTSSIGPGCQGNGIAIVQSLADAVPAFLDHYKNNPVPWEQEGPALHCKETMFVDLRVEQDQRGHWSAYRDNYPMLRDKKPARFDTCADAQRAADAHELDLFP